MPHSEAVLEERRDQTRVGHERQPVTDATDHLKSQVTFLKSNKKNKSSNNHHHRKSSFKAITNKLNKNSGHSSVITNIFQWKNKFDLHHQRRPLPAKWVPFADRLREIGSLPAIHDNSSEVERSNEKLEGTTGTKRNANLDRAIGNEPTNDEHEIVDGIKLQN